MTIPTLAKCCFIIPLTKGLLCFGLLKLALSLFTFSLLNMAEEVTNAPFPIVVLMVDTVFDFVLIAAAYKNHFGLFKTYLYYGASLLVVQIWAVLLMLVFIDSLVMNVNILILFSIFTIAPVDFSEIGVCVADLLIQAYLVLLVLSAVRKLKNSLEISSSPDTGDTSKVTSV